MLQANSTSSFDLGLQRLLDLREGVQAVETLVRTDPQQRYALWFNEAMTEVCDNDIERAYLHPQSALARMVIAGRIQTVSDFLKMTSAVLIRTALKYRVRAYHKDHPRVPAADGCPSSRLLFVGPHAFEPPATGTLDPVHLADRSARQRVLLAEARALGLLLFRVYRAVRNYEYEHGSHYGAFRAIAQRTLLDWTGRVIGLIPSRAAVDSSRVPAPATVRRVRKMYADAAEWVQSRALCLGYNGVLG